MSSFWIFFYFGALKPHHDNLNSILRDEVSHFECQASLLTLSRLPSDQLHISPAASPETWHHTVWRTWLLIPYSDKIWLYSQFSIPHLYIAFRRLGECAFNWLGSERVNLHRSEPRSIIFPRLTNQRIHHSANVHRLLAVAAVFGCWVSSDFSTFPRFFQPVVAS